MQGIKRFIKDHRLEVAIFIVALVARLALFFVVFAHNHYNLLDSIHGDDGYYEISQGILAGHGFTWDTVPPFSPNPLRPPVWPFAIAFFAGVFKTYWAVFAFEMILGAFIPVLSFLAAEKLFGRRAGKWTGFMLSFEPYLVLFSFLLYTETMFIFLFLIGFLFLIKYFSDKSIRALVWMTVFFGLATLVKPTIEYMPFLLALIMIFAAWREGGKAMLKDKQLWTHIALAFAVFGAIIAPWVCRNYREFGAIGMSAQPAYNLYVYLMPTVLAIDEHSTFDAEQAKYVRVDGFSDTESITLATGDAYSKKAISVILDHKKALVESGLVSLVTFFTHDGALTVLGYAGIIVPNTMSRPAIGLIAHPVELIRAIGKYIVGPGAIILILRLFWVVVTVLFIWGVWKYFKKEGAAPAAGAALLLVLYFALTTAINGFGVNARFRMPVDAFILGFALYGLFSPKRDNTRTIPERA
ncbi:MAG TPA: glycosyltransferase family 39 protein [Candidatus Paceibacterota bacterium]|nr:glycosyltransferase family 39 protein [Candidatus Paceibacterota bacterium]